MRRRQLLALGMLGSVAAGRSGPEAAEPRRVAVRVSRFAFEPSEIAARRGEPLVLELRTEDFVHGFAVPELGARVDLVPGRTVTLGLTPPRAGRFTMLCDNFCGEGHDRMSGWLVVNEA